MGNLLLWALIVGASIGLGVILTLVLSNSKCAECEARKKFRAIRERQRLFETYLRQKYNLKERK